MKPIDPNDRKPVSFWAGQELFPEVLQELEEEKLREEREQNTRLLVAFLRAYERRLDELQEVAEDDPIMAAFYQHCLQEYSELCRQIKVGVPVDNRTLLNAVRALNILVFK